MLKQNFPKALIPTVLGTALEWAEYTFFAYMTASLSVLFFPSHDQALGLLKTYALFATSYFMRPLGAMLFGTLGDRLGRKPALVGAMLLMSIATTSIGMLPTYSTLGPTAALLLLVCRLLQGLAVSGEFNGAAVFMYEQNHSRPFLLGSLVPFASALGMSLGAGAAFWVTLPGAPEYAWRIPFLASGLLGLVALYLRTSVQESFKPSQSRSEPSFLSSATFQQYKSGLTCTAALATFISVWVYISGIYYKTLCIKSGFDLKTASEIATLGQLLAAFCILGAGFLADRISGKKMCFLGLGLALFLSPVVIGFGQSGHLGLALLGQGIYALINGIVSAPMMTLLMKQFPPHVRFRGNALAWSLPTALFGGTALLVADALLKQFGFWGPGLYLSLVAGITLFWMKREIP